jgi:hypothetical protein
LDVDLADLPFDSVIVTEAGERRIFTPADLLALPLHKRVRWLLDETLEFRLGPALVDRREALAALRRVQALSTLRRSGYPERLRRWGCVRLDES